MDVVITASQVAYKHFRFWSIDYKYGVSWEYAELLIGLGPLGSGEDGLGIFALPSAAARCKSAPVIQQHLAGAGGDLGHVTCGKNSPMGMIVMTYKLQVKGR